jgi:hypothetical protein
VATTKKSTGSLYCLRIELEGVTPLIWRKFWVEGDMTLIQLHHTIQAVMGWTDSHIHEYQIGGARYRTPHPDDDIDGDDAIDDRTVPLHKVLKGISHFGYQYDFGDAWNHTITVEKTEPMPEHPRGCAFIEEGKRGFAAHGLESMGQGVITPDARQSRQGGDDIFVDHMGQTVLVLYGQCTDGKM